MKKIILLGLALGALGAAALVTEARAAASQDGERAAARVYYRDGTRYALEGRLDEAAAAFEQAVRLDPKDGDAYFSLGNVYAEQGRWADAVAAYRRAVSLRKKDGEAYNGLGVALAARGEYKKAASAFERAAEIYPQWAEPRFHLSHVYKKLGQDVAAQVAYSEALERRPDYASNPPRSFTTQFVRTRVEPRAEKASANVNAAAPSAPPATPPKANDARAAERPAPAVEEVSPYELGLRHSRAGRHEEAVEALTQAVRLDRNNAAAFSALGAAHARLGRWRESVDAYEQAVRLDPKDASAYEMLGRSYAKLREPTTQAPPAGGDAESASGVRAGATSGASAAAPPPAAKDAFAPTDADPTAVYRVGPGDVLEVLVPGARESRASVHKVTPAGLLDYQRPGSPLKVEGLTTDEIASRLGAELKRRGVADAEVSVGVREYESHAVIVSGMVKDPGTKILRREGVPLYVIVAHAQPLPGAGQVLVASKATGRSTAVNLTDAAAMNMLVRPGDVISVQALPRQFYYVAGAVRQPGQRQFHSGLTLTQALLAAGGVLPPGATFVNISRQGDDGRLVTTRYNLKNIAAGRAPDPVIQPGDRVEIIR